MVTRTLRTFVVVALMALAFSACKKHNPNVPSPTDDTEYVTIPVADPSNLEKAFLRFHRPDDAVVVNPSYRSSGVMLAWYDLKDNVKSWRTKGCSISATSDGDWNPETKIFTCIKFETDNLLPLDTEIYIWGIDSALAPPQVAREFIVNGILLPPGERTGIQSWPVGVFKIGRDLKPYW